MRHCISVLVRNTNSFSQSLFIIALVAVPNMILGLLEYISSNIYYRRNIDAIQVWSNIYSTYQKTVLRTTVLKAKRFILTYKMFPTGSVAIAVDILTCIKLLGIWWSIRIIVFFTVSF